MIFYVPTFAGPPKGDVENQSLKDQHFNVSQDT